MKKTFTVLSIICSLTVFGQTAEEHLQNGVEKHTQHDYKGAIKEYDKAIKEDKTNRDAYYNRGTCELALKDFKSAMTDFSKAIELDPKFVKAYYSRATVFVSQKKYVEALPDLDTTVDLDPATPNALTLRGQIRAQTGNKIGACEDFNQAKQVGDNQAEQYLSQFCSNEPQGTESFILDWPQSENWKVGSRQEDENMVMLEYIPSNETLETWTEIGTMVTTKRLHNLSVVDFMKMITDQTKKNAPEAKVTFKEKDESAEYPWIIFTIESPGFKNDRTPESQLWYIVQGKTSVYTSFRAVKQAMIPADLQDKWIKFFKTGRVGNK